MFHFWVVCIAVVVLGTCSLDFKANKSFNGSRGTTKLLCFLSRSFYSLQAVKMVLVNIVFFFACAVQWLDRFTLKHDFR